jgi:predicted Rossmann-fold nucleotide-binding protein
MRVIVCGGRDFNDFEYLSKKLEELHKEKEFKVVIHGNAMGADRMAGRWAKDKGIKVISCPADWLKHGKAAGHIRNGKMLTLKPDAVIAFPGGRGTENMIHQSIEAGVSVIKC